MTVEADIEDGFAGALLSWHRKAGRHDLPWQQDPTPYRVWVSEIMLQQTQVSTVRPYYQRWMESFPDVSALAGAPLDAVLHHWSGLGYYARARNLHRAAQTMVEQHGGEVPEVFDALVSLPGIGRSTAGAILALSLGQRHPILDGNVRRVLARVYAVAGWPGKREVEKQLWALAEAHTPDREVAAYTQAIMDLGATVCSRGRPDCAACPVSDLCAAHALGEETAFPAPRPKKDRPVKATWMALLVDGQGRVALQRRPPAGIWGGLWSFPEYPSLEALRKDLADPVGVRSDQLEVWPVISHGFTHYQLEIAPVLVQLGDQAGGVEQEDDWRWIAADAPPGLGLAAPVSDLLRRLAERPGSESVTTTA